MRDRNGDGEWDEDGDAKRETNEQGVDEPWKPSPTSTLDGGGQFSSDRERSGRWRGNSPLRLRALQDTTRQGKTERGRRPESFKSRTSANNGQTRQMRTSDIYGN